MVKQFSRPPSPPASSPSPVSQAERTTHTTRLPHPAVYARRLHVRHGAQYLLQFRSWMGSNGPCPAEEPVAVGKELLNPDEGFHFRSESRKAQPALGITALQMAFIDGSDL